MTVHESRRAVVEIEREDEMVEEEEAVVVRGRSCRGLVAMDAFVSRECYILFFCFFFFFLFFFFFFFSSFVFFFPSSLLLLLPPRCCSFVGEAGQTDRQAGRQQRRAEQSRAEERRAEAGPLCMSLAGWAGAGISLSHRGTWSADLGILCGYMWALGV